MIIFSCHFNLLINIDFLRLFFLQHFANLFLDSYYITSARTITFTSSRAPVVGEVVSGTASVKKHYDEKHFRAFANLI